jgi:acyl carrier protein
MTTKPRDPAETVARILADQFGIDEADITPEKTLYELGADSLDTIELLMAFEEEYDIDIEEEEVENITTVAGILAYIEERTKPDEN